MVRRNLVRHVLLLVYLGVLIGVLLQFMWHGTLDPKSLALFYLLIILILLW